MSPSEIKKAYYNDGWRHGGINMWMEDLHRIVIMNLKFVGLKLAAVGCDERNAHARILTRAHTPARAPTHKHVSSENP